MSTDYELLNLADYSKKDVIRYLMDNYNTLCRWRDTGNSVAHSILIDLDACLEHEYLKETQKRALIDFYIKEYRLTELAQDYHLTVEGVKYRVQGGISRMYELLNNEAEGYSLF